MAFSRIRLLAFVFGLLGNIVSFMVFLAPVPTFITIFRKKSSDGFQSLPYMVALSSAMLLLYYGVLKNNANMTISINAIGIAIEVTYLTIYMIYASKGAKIFTLRLLVLFNVVGYGLMVGSTLWFLKGPQRVNVVGWLCAAIRLAVFAAPLGIMKKVIRTKSVEFMSFSLSFFLTLGATMWFFHGFFMKDVFTVLPNVVGFLIGIAQMTLYMIYKNAKDGIMPTKRPQEDTELRSMDSQELHQIATRPELPDMKIVLDSSRPVESNENHV